MRVKSATFALALLGVSLVPPASADDTSSRRRVSVSPVLEFMDSGRTPGPNDFSALLRRTSGVDVEIETSGLDPSTAYTLWAVVFNRPQYCAASPCGLGDLPIMPGHDPRVQAAVAYVTGGFTGVDGTLRQAGRLYRAKDGVKPTETLFGPGLLDGTKAEIHFVLRGHGPDPGNPLAAIGSFGAGCSDTNPCGDHQVSVHRPR